MQYRPVLLVPNDDEFGADIDRFHHHWSVTRAEYVLPVQQVAGCLQNRPVEEAWAWGPFRGRAELFFPDAGAGRVTVIEPARSSPV